MTEEELRAIVTGVIREMSGTSDKEAAKPASEKVVEVQKNIKKEPNREVQCQEKKVLEEDMIPDIREEDYKMMLGVENAVHPEEFLRIKSMTDARIGLGRCGPRYRTKAYLRILADHAGALDAVQSEAPERVIEENGFIRVQTLCENKSIYMARPDLGRMFSDEMKNRIEESCVKNPDVQIIVSEGLSSTAMEQNTTDLLLSLEQGLKIEGLTFGTPIYVKYSRVPAMDVITELLHPKVTIMLIGERPGLSTYASMSAYMTYDGKVGMPESGRNVVSNIHANGTNPMEAGAHLAGVVKKMIEQKASGTDLQLY